MRKDYQKLNTSYTYLVTGSAGFIGFHLTKQLLELGCRVIGYDNLNDYYDPALKMARLEVLSQHDLLFTFIEGDLADKEKLDATFAEFKPQIVVNLAAQAGVRYSIDNPQAYLQANLVGFFNVLEACRHFPVKHLLYASSSSVYGMNSKIPFSTADKSDSPVSLYAATKKSNELLAHSYCHLYGIPSTGLRFFTVYGPYGRPDMAYFSFTEKILAGRTIKVFNQGDMYRDFTYIDDIVEALQRILCNPPLPNEQGNKYKLYNIGNNSPEKLLYFIETLEKSLGRKAKIEFLPMQPGDVYQTYADVSALMEDFDFKPDTALSVGIDRFVQWYKTYYDI
ncbi:MAG TPA: NAD-dependent epimerase/dehydratase family protein [Spirochaetales bacterium]|jgi:UDP-glucuronate 4-epimerase|nr:NAD-dependent epimerase/dehydratase family protein [Spirochaetales bacterium]